jgi:hypothetical protein
MDAKIYAARWDVTLALSDAIDAGGFETRTWLSGDSRIARVYVTRTEYLGRKGRKVTECGHVEVRDGIDFGQLTRQAGTIEGLCDGIRFVPAAVAPKAACSAAVHEDALDQLEAEAARGLGVESERFG